MYPADCKSSEGRGRVERGRDGPGEPVLAMSEAVQSLSKPAHAISEAVQSVSEPVRVPSELAHTLSEPVQSLSEAVQTMSELVHSISEPVQSIRELVQRISVPGQAIREVVQSISEVVTFRACGAPPQTALAQLLTGCPARKCTAGFREVTQRLEQVRSTL